MSRRALRLVLLALAGLYAVYVVAGNIALRTRLLRDLIATDEERMLVEYGSAWTLLPGRVHVTDLRLRIQDDNIQALIGLEQATFQLDPFALFSRTFHLTQVRADGVTFRMRHKLLHPEEEPRRVAAYPPIPGFADPPRKVPKPNLPIPESEYHLWTVQLDDVAATLRELWIMEVRYRGRGSVAGAFRLRPIRELWVDPSVLVTEEGVVSIGDDAVLLRSHGRVEARVEPYDVRVPRGVELLRHVTATVALEGEVPDLAPLARMYAAHAPVLVRRGAGHLAIDARLAAGVLARGAHASYTAKDVEIDAAPGSVAGDLRALATVNDELRVEAHVGAARALLRGSDEPALTAEGLHATASFVGLDVVSGLEPGAITLDASAFVAPDLRRLAPLAPHAVTLEGGRATARLRGSSKDGALEGRLDIGLDRASAHVGSVGLVASGRAWAGFASADPGRFVAIGPCGIDLAGIDLAIGDHAHEAGLWAHVRAREANVRPPGSATATLHVEAGPGERTLRLLASVAKVPELAADAVSGGDLVADLRLDRDPEAFTLSLVDAHNGKLGARGRLATARSDTNGAFLLAAGPFTAGVEVKDGHASVTPLVRSGWLDERLGH